VFSLISRQGLNDPLCQSICFVDFSQDKFVGRGSAPDPAKGVYNTPQLPSRRGGACYFLPQEPRPLSRFFRLASSPPILFRHPSFIFPKYTWSEVTISAAKWNRYRWHHSDSLTSLDWSSSSRTPAKTTSTTPVALLVCGVVRSCGVIAVVPLSAASVGVEPPPPAAADFTVRLTRTAARLGSVLTCSWSGLLRIFWEAEASDWQVSAAASISSMAGHLGGSILNSRRCNTVHSNLCPRP